MAIEIGDYIRTEQWGIAKVAKIDEKGKCTFIKNKNNRITHYFTQLGETSKNIIELVEVGDFVNGEYVEEINKGYVMTNVRVNNKPWFSTKIKTILTKEQYEQYAYKVEV